MLKPRPAPVALTADEAELADLLAPAPDVHDPRFPEYLDRACAAARPLALSLLQRGAIPAVRLDYATDKGLNVGAKHSRLASFEAAGLSDEEALSDPNFLPLLRYWIFGPDLPLAVIEGFCQRVEASPLPRHGLEGLRKFARQITRSHRMEPADAAEEFFKLALECGLPQDLARSVRHSVRTVR